MTADYESLMELISNEGRLWGQRLQKRLMEVIANEASRLWGQ